MRSHEDVLREFGLGDYYESCDLYDVAIKMADHIIELEASPVRVVVTDEMVDRAARSLQYHESIPTIRSWDKLPEYQRERYRDRARFAITAALTEGRPDA